MLHITERCINATAAWDSIHRLNVPSLSLKVLLATLTVAAAVEAVVGAVAAGAATTNAEWTRSELEPGRSREQSRLYQLFDWMCRFLLGLQPCVLKIQQQSRLVLLPMGSWLRMWLSSLRLQMLRPRLMRWFWLPKIYRQHRARLCHQRIRFFLFQRAVVRMVSIRAYTLCNWVRIPMGSLIS